jgi:hypothetical protein
MKLSDLLSLLGDLEKDHNKAYQLDLHSDGSGTIYSSVFGDEQTLSKFHSLAMLESLKENTQNLRDQKVLSYPG